MIKCFQYIKLKPYVEYVNGHRLQKTFKNLSKIIMFLIALSNKVIDSYDSLATPKCWRWLQDYEEMFVIGMKWPQKCAFASFYPPCQVFDFINNTERKMESF